MPLYKGRCFSPVKPVTSGGLKDTIYIIPHTNEQFVSKDEYEKRLSLYTEPIWTCQCTGATKLTHREALESERKALKQLALSFPVVFEKPILELVHLNTSPLEALVDRASKRLYEMLVIGEHVTLKVTSHGATLRGVVVKIDTSVSTEKLNGVAVSGSGDISSSDEPSDNTHKKAKLLPFKYGVKLDGEDSIINGIPAADLIREVRVPNKDLVKLFIRAHALRSNSLVNCPWIVDENFVRKHSLPPVVYPSPQAKHILEGSLSGVCENSLIKGMCVQNGFSHEKDSVSKPGSLKKLNGEVSPKKRKHLSPTNLSKKYESPSKKGLRRTADEPSDADSDMPLAELQNCISDDDDDIVLSNLNKAAKKLKKSHSLTKGSENRGTKMKSKIKQNGTVKSAAAGDDDDDDDVALAVIKKKKADAKQQNKNLKKSSSAGPPIKKLKQVTLYQLVKKAANHGTKSPSKSKTSAGNTPLKTPGKTPPKQTPKKSPYRLPPVVVRLEKTDKEKNKQVYCQLLSRCCKELAVDQIKALPAHLRAVIEPKFEAYQEKKRVAAMNPEEREAYLKKKKEEAKEKLREKMKQKWAEAKKRYEDTELSDLKPLPTPKIVATPDGIANELFGDVAMILEFIGCYRGLLMPDKNCPITADDLMKALVSGEDGFKLLSQVLIIMLQTLLQDQLAEDYEELSSSLSELPLNDYTASELVRLCLRHHDAGNGGDANSDVDDIDDVDADDEVPAEVIEQLETNEFYELEPPIKLQILVGLCHRIMASYSVQDYMDEKNNAACNLWKQKIAGQKMQKDIEKEKKVNKGKKKAGDGDKSGDGVKSTLEIMIDSAAAAASAPSDAAGFEEDDMLSVVKRRRELAAKAAEEKKKREAEEKIIREKETAELRLQREKDAFEKAFKDGITAAKRAMRHMPLGCDRNHDRYWFFPAAAAGLYVEKGWAGDDMNYTVSSQAGTSLSLNTSDSDGNSDTEENDSGVKSLNQTLPHIGQNLWFFLDSVDDIHSLCENLHPRGVRESVLKEELKKNLDAIIKSVSSTSARSSADETKNRDDLIEGTRKELEDIEVRLRHGGLGGVPDFQRWTKKLAAAATVQDFGECLFETQANVYERFLSGMMAKDKKQEEKSEEPDEDQEDNPETVRDKKKTEDGITEWMDAVAQCCTLSRLNVLIGILESCVKWEKSAENAKCKICRKKGEEDHLLLCDECNQAFHLYCLRPALFEVPRGEWFCPACSPTRTPRRARSVARSKWGQAEDSSDEDEDEDSSEDIEHENICTMCGEEGELVECSTCPSSFHLDCHDPPLRHFPRQNTWKCVQCRTGIRIRKSRRQPRQQRRRYVDSEDDDDDGEDDVEAKPVKKSSRTATKQKETAISEQRASRSRQNRDDEAGSAVVNEKAERRSAGGKSGRFSSSKENRCSDEDKQAILEVISKLCKHRQSWPFLEPVNANEVPDYYDVVKKPIDLGTMEGRCVSELYTTPQKFVDDFALMMNNAVLYNNVDSDVCKCIGPFEKYFEVTIARFLPGCKYCRRVWSSI